MQDSRLDIDSALKSLAASRPDLWKITSCGVTRSGRQIPALLDRDAYAPQTNRARVLVMGGLSGREQDVELALRLLETFAAQGNRLRDRVALSAIPCGNPDGLALGVWPANGAGGNPTIGYPPPGGFFHDPHDPEARYIWRWACFQAPDVVLELREADSVKWEANAAAASLGRQLGAAAIEPKDSLVAAIGTGKPDNLGPIPGLRLSCPFGRLRASSEANLIAEMERLWAALGRQSSPARQALDARRSRSPLQIARVLASVYGRKLDPVIYTQGVAISGRLRLARLDSDSPSPVPDIVSLVEPYASGARDAFGDKPGTSNLAGLVWADELYEATGDRRYADMALKAASRYEDIGREQAPPPSDADFRTEDMFMNGAMLGRAFKLSGDRKYLDMLTGFILNSGIQQADGLFWHCRSAPYYWGRGNGFALMGLAETLTYLPDDHPDRGAVMSMYLKHLDGLRPLQQPSGMYLQVLDFPGAYQELTATCMIGYSIARGMRRGWLDSSYMDWLRLTWQGFSERIDEHGNVVDGCTGTGVQKNLREYLDRPAIFGYDDRTGNLALWFAVEMESLLREL